MQGLLILSMIAAAVLLPAFGGKAGFITFILLCLMYGKIQGDL